MVCESAHRAARTNRIPVSVFFISALMLWLTLQSHDHFHHNWQCSRAFSGVCVIVHLCHVCFWNVILQRFARAGWFNVLWISNTTIVWVFLQLKLKSQSTSLMAVELSAYLFAYVRKSQIRIDGVIVSSAKRPDKWSFHKKSLFFSLWNKIPFSSQKKRSKIFRSVIFNHQKLSNSLL